MRKLDEKMLAEIAKLRALGFSQQEIANRLGVSQTTVAYHLKKLRELSNEKGEDEAFNAIIAALFGVGAGVLLGYILSQILKRND